MSAEMLTLAAPIVIELTKKAVSAFREWSDIKKAQEELKESRLPLSDLINLSPDQLIQEILKLRTHSLQLFDGLDFYQSELDEALRYFQTLPDESSSSLQSLQGELKKGLPGESPSSIQSSQNELKTTPAKTHARTQAYDLRIITLIYTVQTQMETIANLRSELERGYVDLLRHEYPLTEDFGDRYSQSRTILKEKPKFLFKQDADGESARQTTDRTLVELRNILSKERDKWEKEDAFVKRVVALTNDTEQLYKQIVQNGWGLDEDIRKRYHEARDILALPISVLKSEERKSDLGQVSQVLLDLQVVVYNGQQDELKEREAEKAVQRAKAESEERKRQAKIDEQKQIQRLLILIGVFIVVPVSLLLIGLGVLIWQFGNSPSNLNAKIPFLGIPYSILLWSGLGSIASMLHLVNIYREHHFQTTWRMFRWAVTRPLIGIIMGIVIYLAVSGGLVITVGEFSPSNYSLLWLFSFVGGFSDRVQQALISLVVGKMQFLSDRDSSES